MLTDLIDWDTGEWPPTPNPQTPASEPARPKARPGTLPEQRRAAIEDIARRYPGELNDDIPHDL